MGPVAVIVALAVLGAAAAVFGVYDLAGRGPAAILAGALLIGAAQFMRSGMTKNG